MSDQSPLSGEERKSNFGAAKSVDDPNRTFERLDLRRKLPTLVSRASGTGLAMRRREFIGLVGDALPPGRSRVSSRHG